MMVPNSPGDTDQASKSIQGTSELSEDSQVLLNWKLGMLRVSGIKDGEEGPESI